MANTAPRGNNTSCTQPKYLTISAALAGSPAGATINVCAGTYPEQLAIKKSVTLTGLGSVTVQGPSSPASNLTACDADGGSQPNQDVVDICGSITVTMSGFTVQGGWPSNVCYNSIYGIAVLGHATVTLSGTTVTNIGGDPQSDGCQGGVGVQVGLATSGTAADPGTATLSNVSVKAYQKNGITIDGRGSKATLTGDTVTGTGPTPAIAQNGIQVSDGATASITSAYVTGNECNVSVCGPNALTQTQSTGILLFDAGATTVSKSRVKANDLGVYNLEDFAWTYYTPPSPFTPVNNTFTTMTLANRYENAGFDEGVTTLSHSGLTGGEDGVVAFQFTGDATAVVGTVSYSTITYATADAVAVASDQQSGDSNVKLTVTNDILSATNAGGVSNGGVSFARASVNATDDWWDSASGPSVWGFGSGSSVSADVNFFPWATNEARTTFQSCTSSNSATTTGNDVVLCAPSGTSNAFLRNNGTGSVLLLGNSGNDQLVGSATGKTWIIGGRPGSNVINGQNGAGFIQVRGNPNDTLLNTSNDTVAPR